ncbi:MAG: hypothetical protein HeimC2_25640 [Candidatus Heimdallarchaeota archaeon LC_2]|nr:MAG: hypothetical protein HeimC2_25640 [Candidatus Heimdallarchaeota archaeon LC_2]
MSPNYKLITVIPFGYTLEDDKPKGKKIRKPPSEIAHTEKFGNPIKLDYT